MLEVMKGMTPMSKLSKSETDYLLFDGDFRIANEGNLNKVFSVVHR
jgi:hypothetical protein